MKKFPIFLLISLFFSCNFFFPESPDNQGPENPPSAGSFPNDASPLGINLSGVIDWSAELVFRNYVKRMREWVPQRDGAAWGEGGDLDLDQNGWIRSLEEGQSADLFLGSAPHYEAGTYTLLYQGEGRFRVPGGELSQSGGTFEVAEVGDGDYLTITLIETNPEDYINNIQVVHEGQLDGYLAGERFYESFLETWETYGTLRFMDWGQTNNNMETSWATRTEPEDYSYHSSVPLEIRVELANRLHAKPWFCLPHQADDGYVREFASYVRDNLDQDLPIYIEHSNEVWNPVFQQYHYANIRAQELGIDLLEDGEPNQFFGVLRYHALRTAQIIEIWQEVFGNTDRFIGVYGVGGPSAWMLQEGMYYLESIGMDHYIHAAALAPYVGHDGDYSTIDEAIAVLQEGIDPQTGTYISVIQEVKEAADQTGLRLIAYEGGQHLWNFGQQFSPVGEEAQADPRMENWVLDYMNLWREHGGHEFMVFASGGGFWGQIPWGMSPEVAPKYRAHAQFIQENPVWWED